jgi:spore coat polysaccharide biosynthesis protein SpsF
VRTGIFVQVRLGSTRLPRKALLPLPGGCVIQHVMRALSLVPAETRALLTDPQSADLLRPLAEAEGYEVFAGDPEDVLRRYCDGCRHFDTGRVVRVTGDNPLTSGDLAAEILGLHAERRTDLSHFLGLPWGMGVEVVEADALYIAERDARLPDEREHLTTFLYRNPGRFAIHEPQAPAGAHCPEARVTVDTPDDYEHVRRIFEELYRGAPLAAEEVVAWERRTRKDMGNG